MMFLLLGAVNTRRRTLLELLSQENIDIEKQLRQSSFQILIKCFL
jgi:hypothetical protein